MLDSFRFGVELELSSGIPRSTINYILKKILLKYNYKISFAENNESFTVKEDCSCGSEITTPALPLTEEHFYNYINIIKSFKQMLLKQKYLERDVISSRCGLHVHLEQNHVSETTNNLIKLTLLLEPLIMKTQTYSRKNNIYNYILSNNLNLETGFLDNYNIINNIPNELFIHDHYKSLNISNKGTFEFRYANSTLNYNNIKYYLILLFLIYDISLSNTINIELPIQQIDNTKSFETLISKYNISTQWIKDEYNSLIRWIDNIIKRPFRNFCAPQSTPVIEIPYYLVPSNKLNQLIWNKLIQNYI